MYNTISYIHLISIELLVLDVPHTTLNEQSDAQTYFVQVYYVRWLGA